MRISDWSSDVCSSDLPRADARLYGPRLPQREAVRLVEGADRRDADPLDRRRQPRASGAACREPLLPAIRARTAGREGRSEEHTSELQSLMRISYAVFCLKKKTSTEQASRIKSDIHH